MDNNGREMRLAGTFGRFYGILMNACMDIRARAGERARPGCMRARLTDTSPSVKRSLACGLLGSCRDPRPPVHTIYWPSLRCSSAPRRFPVLTRRAPQHVANRFKRHAHQGFSLAPLSSPWMGRSLLAPLRDQQPQGLTCQKRTATGWGRLTRSNHPSCPSQIQNLALFMSHAGLTHPHQAAPHLNLSQALYGHSSTGNSLRTPQTLETRARNSSWSPSQNLQLSHALSSF
jgi:hypothetical protein